VDNSLLISASHVQLKARHITNKDFLGNANVTQR